MEGTRLPHRHGHLATYGLPRGSKCLTASGRANALPCSLR